MELRVANGIELSTCIHGVAPVTGGIEYLARAGVRAVPRFGEISNWSRSQFPVVAPCTLTIATPFIWKIQRWSAIVAGRGSVTASAAGVMKKDSLSYDWTNNIVPTPWVVDDYSVNRSGSERCKMGHTALDFLGNAVLNAHTRDRLKL